MRFGLEAARGGDDYLASESSSDEDDVHSDGSAETASPTLRRKTLAPAINTQPVASTSKPYSPAPFSFRQESPFQDAEGDSSEYDSEEDAFPVAPLKGSSGVGVHGWGRQAQRSRGIGDLGSMDAYELWEQKQKELAWMSAMRSMRSPLPSPLMATSPSTARAADSLAGMLESMTLEHTQAVRALHDSFEVRNKQFWHGIDGAIAAEEQAHAERERKRREEAERAKREEEARKREEEEAQRKQQQEAQERERKQQEKQKRDEAEKKAQDEKRKADQARTEAEQAAAASGALVSPRLQYQKWASKMAEIKSTVLPAVSATKEWRSACFQAKRTITPKIGQLTNSASAIATITAQLAQTLDALRPLSPNDEPYVWGLNHLAKAMIKQAEAEVTAKLGTAYPLARVTIGLILRGHDAFADVLMARLVKKCWWIVAHRPGKPEGQSMDDYAKVLGQKAGETPQQYITRATGLVALYAAVAQVSPLEQPQVGQVAPATAAEKVPGHLRPGALWTMLAALTKPPVSGLAQTPAVIHTVLLVAGRTMARTYGRQWTKLCGVLWTEGVRNSKLGTDDERSARARLGIWLEDWEKKHGQGETVPEIDVE